MLYTLRFFSLQNAVCFVMLTCLVPVLFTFYIQDVLKLRKIIPAPKGKTVILLEAVRYCYLNCFSFLVALCLGHTCLSVHLIFDFGVSHYLHLKGVKQFLL